MRKDIEDMNDAELDAAALAAVEDGAWSLNEVILHVGARRCSDVLQVTRKALQRLRKAGKIVFEQRQWRVAIARESQ